jgi:molybdate transport system substrate-binding protein
MRGGRSVVPPREEIKMKKIMKAPLAGASAVVAISFSFFLDAGMHVTNASAAEIKLALANALVPVVTDLTGAIEQDTGHTLVLTPGTAGAVFERVRDGEIVDVVMITAPQMDELAKLGKITAESQAVVAKSGLGVAIRAGAPKPDISSVEAFKNGLLAAKSIGYADPAGGAATGVHIAKVIGDLGIAEDVAPKTTLVSGAKPNELTQLVGEGKVEIGITQVSLIVGVSGVELVGPLPAELQNTTVFTAGVVTGGAEPDAAKALIEFLTGPAAEDAIRARGLEPG